jgi:hypothetical protein
MSARITEQLDRAFAIHGAQLFTASRRSERPRQRPQGATGGAVDRI